MCVLRVPLYFLAEFVVKWRRRRGHPELNDRLVYCYSVLYFILMIAPGVLFSRVVTNNVDDRSIFGRLVG